MALLAVRMSVAETCHAIEQALGVTFVGRESSYLGEYEMATLRRHGKVPAEVVLKLRRNIDPMWREGDPLQEQLAEPRFPLDSHLLYVQDAAGKHSVDFELVEALVQCGLVVLDINWR